MTAKSTQPIRSMGYFADRDRLEREAAHMIETGIVSIPVADGSSRLPALFQALPEGGRRFWEFFTVNIRNPNTRRAYFKSRRKVCRMVCGAWSR